MPTRAAPGARYVQPHATSSSPYGCSESSSRRSAPSMSREETPGSETIRTMTSRRGKRTVAVRWVAPRDLRKRVYSAPHSAAGREAKSEIAKWPSTRMRDGRTRAATISRSWSPISTPTPEPKRISLRRSSGMGICRGMTGISCSKPCRTSAGCESGNRSRGAYTSP